MTSVDETKPGEARCPGPSTRDIGLADSAPPPAPLLVESYEFRGDADIAYEEFTSPEYAQAEFDHMWSRTWQWACREEHIPEEGDYHVHDIGDRSALIVRGPDGTIRAFANACLHRGVQLKASESTGWSPKLRCPFHGWQWDTDGTLDDIPCQWDFPHADIDSFALPQLQVDTWGGFVFVNFDEHAPPLRDYLGVLPDHFAAWDLTDRFVEVHVRKRLPANWKAATAAFLEAYHVVETHSHAVMVTGDANAQYDVFDEHVSRFWHTIGTTSPHIPEEQRPDEETLLKMLLAGKTPEDPPEIPEGQRARDVYARQQQEALGKFYDNDFSGYSVAETIDSIEYFLFPNAMFFPGLQIPMAYRFRPDGIDASVFEVLMLRPKPQGKPTPPPAEPFDLDVHDSWTTVPGLPPSLGFVFDQDTANLGAQTKGFKASVKQGQTLGNYQEVRVRHLHDTVRRYIESATPVSIDRNGSTT